VITIPINDISKRVQRFNEVYQSAISRVLKQANFVLGKEVQIFEEKFAAYLGIKHCVGVGNGTDAIRLALSALGVGYGDRVGLAANAGMYSATMLNSLGCIPHYIDVDYHSNNILLEGVVSSINKGIKAIIITHLYGLANYQIIEIAKICKEKSVFLIEDCAQAHGAEINGNKVGTFGDLATFSFYPTKNLGALGDAGAIVTNKKIYYNRLLRLRQYGWGPKYQVNMINGVNSRLDEIQAAILSDLLPFLDEDNNRRLKIARLYNNNIKNDTVTLPAWNNKDYVAHLYVIKVKNRNGLKRYLSINKVMSAIHYPIPDHKQPIFKSTFKELKLKNTEKLAKNILTLPCYPEMNEKEVFRIINLINEWQ